MNADTIAVLIVAGMALPATAFPVLYAFRPWYKTLLGRALMVNATGLALLIDISLAYKVFGDNYPGRDIVRLAVYTFIFCGTWLQAIALASTFFRHKDPHDL